MDDVQTHSIEPVIFAPLKHAGGRPTKYNEGLLRKAKMYIESCWSINPRVPFVQELSLILDVDCDTIVEWTKKKDANGELVFKEFSATIKRLKTLQELRLLQRCLTRYNPAGAIFLLKTQYGYVEEEKKMLVGKRNEPLVIEIVGEKTLSS